MINILASVAVPGWVLAATFFWAWRGAQADYRRADERYLRADERYRLVDGHLSRVLGEEPSGHAVERP